MYTEQLTEQLKRLCTDAYAMPGLLDGAGNILALPNEDGRAVKLPDGCLNALNACGAKLREGAVLISGQMITAPFTGADGQTYRLFALREASAGDPARQAEADGTADASEAELSRFDALAADHLKLLAAAISSKDPGGLRSGELLEALVTGAEKDTSKAARDLPGACLNAASYRMICVRLGRREDFRQDVMNDVLDVLNGVFTREQGFISFQVRRDNAAAVLVPFTEENGADTLAGGEEFARQAADTVSAEAMHDVATGLSGSIDTLEKLAAGYAQALCAVETGSIFNVYERTHIYEKLSLERLLRSVPKETCMEYVRETLGDRLLNDRSSAELLSTVKTFLDSNQNGSEAARSLYIHRNTMMYRLEKFQKLTGLDCSDFAAGMKVRIALLALNYLEAE